jgi:tyrosyl-tRNA synthetase
MANVIDVLKERGFIDALTSEELRPLADQPLKVYCGFDPTSDSLHLGSLVPIIGLAWWQRYGHTPVAIVGGATGMIGDPAGKLSERPMLDEATLQRNLQGIRSNLEAILDPNHPTAKPVILNNYDWFKGMSATDFLRNVGKFFRIGTMLGKESVRQRLHSEEGMSFTEFSYQLLQAYDFYHLHTHHDVTVQLGGSDQWGNITAGIDLIRKINGGAAYGMTFPLLTRSDGQKFGKSEKGAIWLSSDKLSPYEFYQYLYRVSDQDVIMLMRLLTFMEMDEIRRYEAKMGAEGYQPNSAQKRLAEEVTRIVHGDAGVTIAQQVTQAAAPGATTFLDGAILAQLANDMPSFEMAKSDFTGISLVELMVRSGLQSSKGAAKKLILNGGAYLNNIKVDSAELLLEDDALIDGHLLLLAAGKKNKILIRLK